MTSPEIYNSAYDILILARESGSISELSATLGISVDTLRSRFKALDSLYPLSLFETLDATTVKLSDVGIMVATTAEKIRKLETDLEMKVEKVSSEKQGSICIGSLSKSIPKNIKASCPLKIKTSFFDISAKASEGELKKLGTSNLDVVIGLYDDALLKKFHLEALELEKSTLALAFSASSPLSKKKVLDIEDLYEKKLYLPRRAFSRRIATLSGDLRDFHPRILVQETDGYTEELLKEVAGDADAFILTPLVDLSSYDLRCARVDWSYSMSFGFLYSHKPSEKVESFINTVKSLKE